MIPNEHIIINFLETLFLLKKTKRSWNRSEGNNQFEKDKEEHPN